MLRVGDLQRSIDFYTQVMGMKLLRTTDRPEQKYSLAFVGYASNPEQAEIELTYNYGTSAYELGTAYGHIAIGVADAKAACEKIRAGGGDVKGFVERVKKREPGVKLAPAGVTVRELIDEFCGGMADGHAFHAYLPGGASGGILPAAMDNIPLDFGTLEKYGCFIGSAAVIVLSEQDSVKGAALNLMRFFEDESCGQCTPCRVGTQKAALLMEQPVWNRELLDQLSQAMRDASICGLGQAASNPLTSVIKYFPEEFLPREAAE